MVIAQDDYYLDLAHLSEAEVASYDFDRPEALDNSLLATHLRALRAGSAVKATRSRSSSWRAPFATSPSAKKAIATSSKLACGPRELASRATAGTRRAILSQPWDGSAVATYYEQ